MNFKLVSILRGIFAVQHCLLGCRLTEQFRSVKILVDIHVVMQGSSDSGKGCSDVVTPPSRTPAGGSSVAGDQVPSIFEFVLPQVIVGRLIGRHGSFLHDIRAKTHTNVFIKRHPETNTLKICAVEGKL